MKYFIDTHDKSKGSFPGQELTEEEFFAQFDALEVAAEEFHAFGHAAHVNLRGRQGVLLHVRAGRGGYPQGACGDQFSL